MVGRWASASGPGWSQYAHPEGDPACGKRPAEDPDEDEGEGEESAPDPLSARREARGRHRRTSRVLDDLPSWMPGGLVAAFGLARRHAVAVALAVLVWPLPGWLIAPQTVDALAVDDTAPTAADTAA